MARSNTLTKRAAKAQAKSAGALNLFRSAAAELESAEKEHRDVASIAAAQAERLADLQSEHEQQANEAGTAATKLRELVGGQ